MCVYLQRSSYRESHLIALSATEEPSTITYCFLGEVCVRHHVSGRCSLFFPSASLQLGRSATIDSCCVTAKFNCLTQSERRSHTRPVTWSFYSLRHLWWFTDLLTSHPAPPTGQSVLQINVQFTSFHHPEGQVRTSAVQEPGSFLPETIAAGGVWLINHLSSSHW